MQMSSPRVYGRLFPQYTGRIVSVIGDAGMHLTDNNGHPVIKLSDGIDVTLHLPAGERIDSQYIYVEGKVTGANSISVTSMAPVSQNFDMPTYQKALELMHGKYNYLFS